MGFFDSKSVSETSPITQNAGFSEVSGIAQSLNLTFGKKSKGNAVTLTDGGAVARAFDFGSAALKQVEVAGAQSGANIERAIAALAESSRGETENIGVTAIKWAAFAGIAYFIFRAVRG